MNKFKDMLNHVVAAARYAVALILIFMPLQALDTAGIDGAYRDAYLLSIPMVLIIGFKIFEHNWKASSYLFDMFNKQEEKQKNEAYYQIPDTQESVIVESTTQPVSARQRRQQTRRNTRTNPNSPDVRAEYTRSPDINETVQRQNSV